MAPLLGFITKVNRNATQHAADAAARASMVRFTLAPPGDIPKGTKIILTSLWNDPSCVSDMGKAFTGFRQLTGSCVGVSTGHAITTLSCVQRKLTAGSTKAFIHWWPYSYGTCRTNEGDHGQGEGAIDSVMAQTLVKSGVFSITEAQNLPTFNESDGLALTSQQEYQYSDGAASVNTQYASLAHTHPLGSAAVLSSVADIKAAILNGYPVLDGCDDYIGNGSLSGDVALGNYDGHGGHSTCYLGYYEHETLGPLYLYQNSWAASTYPNDQSGKSRCSVWVKESNVARLFQLGGGGETVA